MVPASMLLQSLLLNALMSNLPTIKLSLQAWQDEILSIPHLKESEVDVHNLPSWP